MNYALLSPLKQKWGRRLSSVVNVTVKQRGKSNIRAKLSMQKAMTRSEEYKVYESRC